MANYVLDSVYDSGELSVQILNKHTTLGCSTLVSSLCSCGRMAQVTSWTEGFS